MRCILGQMGFHLERVACCALLILGGLGFGLRTQAATPAALARVPDTLPGAVAFPEAVRHALAEELASRPGSWEPRTRHRRSDGSPLYTNRLALETSPYLQQHAHNPVDWHPWGPDAFARAKERGQLVFVSIGYSTCHWCHVMEEESFDDVEVARHLNAGFVAIKVDREVRPDVDAVYMAAAQLMNGQGGWPLNVFVTAEGEPVFAGTYFPREDRAGRPGILRVLAALRSQLAADPERVARAGTTISRQVRRALAVDAPLATWLPSPGVLHLAARRAVARADRAFGGTGERQKFPSATPIRFLLRYQRRTGDPAALEVATQTLERMARGGIRDHLGGGFHRYTTDRRWLVPHFEKMLYDNAQLAVAYLEGWQVTGRQDFVAVTREILAYVEAEMTSPEGVFYSATDADSPGPDGELEEGLFFTWTPAEIDAVLGEERGRLARAFYGVKEGGHVEGRSVLHRASRMDEVAGRLEVSPEAFPAMLAEARLALLAARTRRSPPLRDDKVIVAWNALMISAFARAGFALADPEYVARAARAAAFLLDRVRSEGRLHRVWIGGGAEGTAFLDDYAFFIASLLDLYEADSNPRWMREALALQTVLDAHYAEAGGAYFRTPDDAPALLVRQKPGPDSALPSGNSVALSNALRLHAFTLDPAYGQRALGILAAFQDRLQSQPLAFGEMLLALDYQLDAAKEIVIVTGRSGSAEAHLAVVRARFAPNRVIAVVTEEAARAQQALLPLLSGRVAPRGVTTVYVCEEGLCQLPITEPERLREALATIAPLE